MGSSPPSRLTPLQSDLLHAFFEREQRLFLTGGAALAGFYFGHRGTEDLDLFGGPGLDLKEIVGAVQGAIDRAAMVDPNKATFGAVRVDTLREIAANKICTLLSRSEIKDLIDLKALVGAGIDLRQAFADAERKDAGADPATLAWILDQISITPTARLPGGMNLSEIDSFRQDFARLLRTMAFERARRT